ncbi:hypothetical protein D3C81_932600 [compost metagenome]
MILDFNVDKNTGLGFSNLIRQMLIESSMKVKPIAFKLSDGSTLYKPGKAVLDMVSFSSDLADLNFEIDPNVNFPFVQEYTFRGVLNSQNLNTPDIKVEGNKDLLHTVGEQNTVNLTIVFDRNSGFKSSDYNSKRLESLNINLKGFQRMSARYCDVTVSASTKEDLDSEKVSINIESKSSTAKQKTLDALDSIIDKYMEIRENLKNS